MKKNILYKLLIISISLYLIILCYAFLSSPSFFSFNEPSISSDSLEPSNSYISELPSDEISVEPSLIPSINFSEEPTIQPTVETTVVPSELEPTIQPTIVPSEPELTIEPTLDLNKEIIEPILQSYTIKNSNYFYGIIDNYDKLEFVIDSIFNNDSDIEKIKNNYTDSYFYKNSLIVFNSFYNNLDLLDVKLTEEGITNLYFDEQFIPMEPIDPNIFYVINLSKSFINNLDNLQIYVGDHLENGYNNLITLESYYLEKISNKMSFNFTFENIINFTNTIEKSFFAFHFETNLGWKYEITIEDINFYLGSDEIRIYSEDVIYNLKDAYETVIDYEDLVNIKNNYWFSMLKDKLYKSYLDVYDKELDLQYYYGTYSDDALAILDNFYSTGETHEKVYGDITISYLDDNEILIYHKNNFYSLDFALSNEIITLDDVYKIAQIHNKNTVINLSDVYNFIATMSTNGVIEIHKYNYDNDTSNEDIIKCSYTNTKSDFKDVFDYLKQIKCYKVSNKYIEDEYKTNSYLNIVTKRDTYKIPFSSLLSYNGSYYTYDISSIKEFNNNIEAYKFNFEKVNLKTEGLNVGVANVENIIFKNDYEPEVYTISNSYIFENNGEIFRYIDKTHFEFNGDYFEVISNENLSEAGKILNPYSEFYLDTLIPIIDFDGIVEQKLLRVSKMSSLSADDLFEIFTEFDKDVGSFYINNKVDVFEESETAALIETPLYFIRNEEFIDVEFTSNLSFNTSVNFENYSYAFINSKDELNKYKDAIKIYFSTTDGTLYKYDDEYFIENSLLIYSIYSEQRKIISIEFEDDTLYVKIKNNYNYGTTVDGVKQTLFVDILNNKIENVDKLIFDIKYGSTTTPYDELIEGEKILTYENFLLSKVQRYYYSEASNIELLSNGVFESDSSYDDYGVINLNNKIILTKPGKDLYYFDGSFVCDLKSAIIDEIIDFDIFDVLSDYSYVYGTKYETIDPHFTSKIDDIIDISYVNNEGFNNESLSILNNAIFTNNELDIEKTYQFINNLYYVEQTIFDKNSLENNSYLLISTFDNAYKIYFKDYIFFDGETLIYPYHEYYFDEEVYCYCFNIENAQVYYLDYFIDHINLSFYIVKKVDYNVNDLTIHSTIRFDGNIITIIDNSHLYYNNNYYEIISNQKIDDSFIYIDIE